jgi:NTP pyrophosphatase (non-canonical NTP hydrolase)
MEKIDKLDARYLVVKRRDLQMAYEAGDIATEEIKQLFQILSAVESRRQLRGKPARKYVIVSDKNPCYEEALKATLAWANAEEALNSNFDLTVEDRRFMQEVAAEIAKARAKFPDTEITTLAFSEESGELVKAVLDEPKASVRKEAVQVAAMACRLATEGDDSVVNWRKKRGLDPLV